MQLLSLKKKIAQHAIKWRNKHVKKIFTQLHHTPIYNIMGQSCFVWFAIINV